MMPALASAEHRAAPFEAAIRQGVRILSTAPGTGHGRSPGCRQIPFPSKTAESLDSVTLAGLEGVLRAYENMLPTHPGIRSAELDAALAARDKGTLAQFVAALPPMPRR